MSVAFPAALPRGYEKIHSWFESLTTNGFQVAGFKHLAVRPEFRRRATAIFHSFPREKDSLCLARLAPEGRARTSQAPMSFYFFAKIRLLLGKVLSFEAYRVNFFLAQIKTLRSSDVVKLQKDLS
jgi:hypothetical protein